MVRSTQRLVSKKYLTSLADLVVTFFVRTPFSLQIFNINLFRFKAPHKISVIRIQQFHAAAAAIFQRLCDTRQFICFLFFGCLINTYQDIKKIRLTLDTFSQRTAEYEKIFFLPNFFFKFIDFPTIEIDLNTLVP